MTVRIICHMISSVDGKLLPSQWSRALTPIDISAVYEEVASSFDAQGWMIGRKTMAEYDAGVREEQPAPRDCVSGKNIFKGTWDNRLIAVVFDPKGNLHYSHDHLATGEHIVSVTSEAVSDEYLSELRKVGVSYVFEGQSEKDRFTGALESIEKLFGVKTLLLEGGGIINGAFLEAGLIDELSVLIYPGLDGNYGSPSIIGYQGTNPKPAEKNHLELIRAETLPGGMVHLHYRVEHS